MATNDTTTTTLQAPPTEDGVWITEVWESLKHHKASLEIDWVKAAIAAAMPLIAEFKEHILTEPVALLDSASP